MTPLCVEFSPLVDPLLCPIQMSLVNRLFLHTLLYCVDGQSLTALMWVLLL